MTSNKKDNTRFINRILIFSIAITLVIPLNFIPQDVVAPGPPPFDPTIQEIILKVTEQDVENYITDLQNFNTRYAYTSQCNLSAQYIFDEFSNYSALSVESDYFVYNTYLVRNIVATLPGLNETDDTIYLVGGHYDSYSNDRWNNAPGADDDASGTAVALEAAKILSQYRFNSTIKFAAWTTEELGLIGSEHWAKNAALQGMNIGAYLNFDMIGYDPGNNMGLDIGYNGDSIWLSEEMISINENYSIGLDITTGSGGTRSDHASFWQWGYTAVECIESDFNTPNYHTINDTVDKLNMLFDKRVTQLGLATLAKLAGVLTPSVGVLYLDNVAYKPDATVGITLYDTDLNVDPGVIDWALVEMSSDTESGPEIVFMAETEVNSSIFTGSMDLSLGAPSLDSILQVAEGDTIYAKYNDLAPSGIRTKTAKVDGIPPVISNVQAMPDVSSAIISWTTDEPSDSTVFYGISTELGLFASDSNMVTDHSMEILGLEPSLTYYFDVQSSDHAGNLNRDDNLGEHYNFTTVLGISGTSKSGFVGYVKESDATGNYFTGPNIYVGRGAQGIYHGAAQFNKLWIPKDAIITKATVEFFGKRWHYTGSGGSWYLRMLNDTMDSDWQNHGYTKIHNAIAQDTIPPTMLDGDLQSQKWNTFLFNPSQYSALKNHLVNGTISFRLDGPTSGRYLYVWDTGNGGDSWGEDFAPKITVSYDTGSDSQGPVISNLLLYPNPNIDNGFVNITGLISDNGLGGSNITLVRYYNPILKIWVDMGPQDGLFNSPVEPFESIMGIGAWPDGDHTIWIRGLDDSGNWGDIASIIMNKKPTFDIPLSFGWNLISIPLLQSDTSVSNVFSSISGGYDAVQIYDSSDLVDPWNHNNNQKPIHFNDLDQVDHKMGIWVHITEPAGVVLQCSGTLPSTDTSIPIFPGWNLVGYPSLRRRNRTTALNNLVFGSDIDAIWTYDSQLRLWNEITELDEFEAGKGYWVHSKVPKTWTVLN
jgi:Zn-dependent M28 family amino/carboxypeptidase